VKGVNPSHLPDKMVKQNYKFIAILDFEATCEEQTIIYNQEIIEFPCIIINSESGEEVARFQKYVKPIYNPNLTDFCTKLTGIAQSTVDEADLFLDVWRDFQKFMTEGGYTRFNTIFVTCGHWDLKTMFPKQARLSGISIPGYFKKWINIKQLVTDTFQCKCKGMMGMLSTFKIQHIGRHHSGIDDVRNITNCVRFMLKKGVLFKENGFNANYKNESTANICSKT